MKPSAVALSLLVLLAGCGSGSSGKTSHSNTPSTSGAASSTASSSVTTPSGSAAAYNPSINPAQFSTLVTNPYFPLKPGTTFVHEGTRDGKPQRGETTVTSETRTVMGVQCVVVKDNVTSNGALVEQTTDWYAQAANGDVWYFGEVTKEFTNGVVSSTHGSWEAGVDGAQPGIIMKAKPRVGDTYRQEYRPGEAEDMASVKGLDPSLQVPAGTYQNVLVTEDTDPLNPDRLDEKKYGPGVGMVYTKRIRTGHQEEMSLVKVTTA